MQPHCNCMYFIKIIFIFFQTLINVSLKFITVTLMPSVLTQLVHMNVFAKWDTLEMVSTAQVGGLDTLNMLVKVYAPCTMYNL